jgi:hypothetical protein
MVYFGNLEPGLLDRLWQPVDVMPRHHQSEIWYGYDHIDASGTVSYVHCITSLFPPLVEWQVPSPLVLSK